MKGFGCAGYGRAALKLLAAMSLSCASLLGQAADSVRLTDVVKAGGAGRIDLFKDLGAEQLEQLRSENGGVLIFGVDINEAASGTEKASSQGVALASLVLTITFSDSTQHVYRLVDGCCYTETQALLAAAGTTLRTPYYTLLGESGSSRITANNTIQDIFDSTIKVSVPDTLYSPAQGIVATSAIMDIRWLAVNAALGDPEAFYDYSAGFEDLALLNATDSLFVDDYAAGRDEAVAVVLTNPEPVPDPLAIAAWNYFPAADSWYVVAYEDKFPERGDYDFNDLTVAYQVRFGLNDAQDVVSIRGTAYLLTRGAAYNHDWHLRIALPGTATAVLDCTTFLDRYDPGLQQPCDSRQSAQLSGDADVSVFRRTASIFADPGSVFTNTLAGQGFLFGPKSEFRIDFDAPVAAGTIARAPFDPYLQVLTTGRKIQLLQQNPMQRDANGFPFAMLMPPQWMPPLEYINIEAAYPFFADFIASEGTQSQDWYTMGLSHHVVDMPARPEWAW